MEDTAQILRTELRQNDGDLYLCHLFVPTAHRFRMLALYTGYAEIARVPAQVNEPMVGAIRLQWWRDNLEVGADPAISSPVAAALSSCEFPADDIARLIDARMPALERSEPSDLASLEAEATLAGPAFMRLSLAALHQDARALPSWVDDAGIGFELVRLAHLGNTDSVMTRAQTLLGAARAGFNGLARRERAAILPAFLITGLTARFARRWPRQDLLLRHQFRLLVSALRGRI
ncbi:MAG: squalene/phytoene synthase family protein [PS1 clade bacterium]|nr:squalene/phytoene synthase family protein [PS1 clade bacterium]